MVVVTSFDAMWWLVLCHVTWCNAMSWCWAVVCCALQWDGMLWALRGHVVWFEVVLWRCGDPTCYSVLKSKALIKLCLCYKVLLQYYSVLQSTIPVLLRTTKYYSSTTLYYKVLLQYYSVLQSTTLVLQSTTPVLLCTTKYYSSTTPVLLCTTKYYSSTTLYYKELLQYYSVLQSTTPVLLCATKYYSSTTPYYKVLLQYYSVLQSTTPVLPSTTKYSSSTTLYSKVLLRYCPVLQSTTPVLLCTTKYYSSTTLALQSTTPVLLCTTKHHSSTNPYCARLILVTYETSFTMRGATRVTLQLHQIQHVPRKMNLMIDPPHIWNVIYNARSNMSHPPTSPNTAPATQNESHEWSASHMNHHFQCAERAKPPPNLTKYCACHEILSSGFQRKIPELLPPIDDSRIIRTYLNRKSSSRTRRFGDLTRPIFETHFVWKNTTFRAPAISQNVTKCCACHEKSPSNFSKYCTCHAKWISWMIRVTYEPSFPMRGASQVAVCVRKVLRLPRNSEFRISAQNPWIASANRKTIRG